MMPKNQLLLPLLLALPLSSFGQNERKPNHVVTLLPVGIAPPMRVIQQGNERIEADAVKGSIPPRKMGLLAATQLTKTDLRLGSKSTPYSIRINDTRLIKLTTSQDTSETSNNKDVWWETKLPASKRSLVILFRKAKAKNWNQPLGLTLPHDSTAFPSGSTRITNVSGLSVYAIIGSNKKAVLIKPGKFILRKGGEKPLNIVLLVKDNKGKPVRLFRSSIQNTGNRRSDIVLHNAKPRSSGKPPVGVCFLPENASGP